MAWSWSGKVAVMTRHVELMMVPGLHPAHCAMLSTLALFPNVLNRWRAMASWNETGSWSTFD